MRLHSIHPELFGRASPPPLPPLSRSRSRSLSQVRINISARPIPIERNPPVSNYNRGRAVRRLPVDSLFTDILIHSRRK